MTVSLEKATPELFAAMSKAQGEIENASKNSNNPHFKSKYADLAEVLNTIRPTFAANGLCLTQSPSFDGSLVSVTTVVSHNSGGYIVSTASCVPAKTDAQGIGSSTTYLRRYGAAAMAGIAQEDDDGQAARHDGKPAAVAKADDEAEKLKVMNIYADANARSIEAIKTGIANEDYLTAAEAWYELSQDAMRALWVAPSKGGVFTTKEREIMRTNEFTKYKPTNESGVSEEEA